MSRRMTYAPYFLAVYADLISDQMGLVFERLRSQNMVPTRNGESSRSRNVAPEQPFARNDARIRAEIAECDAYVNGLRDDIMALQNQVDIYVQKKAKLLEQLEQSRGQGTSATGGKTRQQGTDYTKGTFDWDDALKKRMKAVFGISEFRLAQRGSVAAPYKFCCLISILDVEPVMQTWTDVISCV